MNCSRASPNWTKEPAVREMVKADTENPGAAVIIPHYNDLARLEKCLAALFSGENASALSDVEVVVVDNASEEDLSGIKAAYSSVRFVTETIKGAAAARNRGVSVTRAPRLFFLDADCVPESDWILHSQQAIENSQIVGGKVGTFDETEPPRSGAEAFETVFAFRQQKYIEEKGFSVTANLLTWRSVFDTVGHFKVGVSEDVDWCWRAREQGFQLTYNENVVVNHPTRQNWPALKRKWQRLTNEAFLLNGIGIFARLKWIARAFVVLVSVVFHIPKLLTNTKLSNFQERQRGLVTLLKLRMWRFAVMLRQAVSTMPQ